MSPTPTKRKKALTIPHNTFWNPHDRFTFHKAYPSMTVIAYIRHTKVAEELGEVFEHGNQYFDGMMTAFHRKHSHLKPIPKSAEELEHILVQSSVDSNSWAEVEESFKGQTGFLPVADPSLAEMYEKASLGRMKEGSELGNLNKKRKWEQQEAEDSKGVKEVIMPSCLQDGVVGFVDGGVEVVDCGSVALRWVCGVGERFPIE